MSDLNENKSASFDPSPNTEFLREKIKAKPINKKKLLRRTLLTALTAAIFGAVACITFLILEPLISERVNSNKSPVETPVEQVNFTDMGDDDTDEILPEDMYVNDTEMIEEALQGNVSEVNQNIQDIEKMIQSLEFGIGDYQRLYLELKLLAETVSYSMVDVVGVTEESNLLESGYENSIQAIGTIVADNGPAFLILVKDVGFTGADKISAVFWDDSEARCSVVGKDNATGLLVVSVNKTALSMGTLNNAKPATLGSSRSSSIKGTPIIALGAPNGIADSICYGTITSDAQNLKITDADYKYLYTDINCGDTASGIIVNLRGSVIGFIDNSLNDTESIGVVRAIGITEIKSLIERISNVGTGPYLGIWGTDVTEAMSRDRGLPEGIYVTNVEMDSPAMKGGIQNGDIIQGVEGATIHNYRELISWLDEREPDEEIRFTVMRQAVDDYAKIEITVTVGTVNYRLEE